MGVIIIVDLIIEFLLYVIPVIDGNFNPKKAV